MNQIWRHCRPPRSGPVTYTSSGSALGWLFTCPYCLTQIDSHSWTGEDVFEIVAEDHLKKCRDHVQSDSVTAAMVPLTEKRDRAGRPIYQAPGNGRSGS